MQRNSRRISPSKLGFFLIITSLQLISCREKTYHVGIVPQQSAEKIIRMWTPLLTELEKKSNVKLQLDTALSLSDFEDRLINQEYDFAYLNPTEYTRKARPHNYLAIVRNDKPLVGVIVVKKNSPYKKITDLKGSRFSFPNPIAYAATELNLIDLSQAGIDIKNNIFIHYVGTQARTVDELLDGYADAACLIQRTFDFLDPATKAKLRIIHKTQPVVSHPFIVHERVSQEIKEKIIQTLLNLNKYPEGVSALNAVDLNHLIRVKNDDYESSPKQEAKQ